MDKSRCTFLMINHEADGRCLFEVWQFAAEESDVERGAHEKRRVCHWTSYGRQTSGGTKVKGLNSSSGKVKQSDGIFTYAADASA